MELAMEKGHSFAEELEKVSNVVSPQAGIFFYPRGLIANTGFALQPSLPLWDTWDQSLFLCEPQFLHLYNEDMQKYSSFTGMWWELHKEREM